jgi:hypothetical protein
MWAIGELLGDIYGIRTDLTIIGNTLDACETGGSEGLDRLKPTYDSVSLPNQSIIDNPFLPI